MKKPKVPVVLRSGGTTTIAAGKHGSRVVRVDSQYTFAFELKNAARVMVNQARKQKDPDSHQMRAFVTGAVTLAYSFLEAALNEFLFLTALAPQSPLTGTEKELIKAIATENLRPTGRQHTLQLFNLLLRLLRKQELEESEQPYQAANVVRLLRNLLVHPVPGRVVTFSESSSFDLSAQQKIVKQLRCHLELGRDATFPWDMLTSTCAAWAVAACEAFFREFVKRSGVDPGFLTD